MLYTYLDMTLVEAIVVIYIVNKYKASLTIMDTVKGIVV